MSVAAERTDLCDVASNSVKRGVKRKETTTAFDSSNCELCEVKFTSSSQAETHFAGKTHLDKARADEATTTESTYGPSPAKKPATESTKSTVETPQQSGTEKAKKPGNDLSKKSPGISLFCSVCNRSFNSIVQAQSHYSGKAHAFRLQMVNLQTLVHDDKNLANPLAAHVLSNLVASSGIPPSPVGILPLPVNGLVLPPPLPRTPQLTVTPASAKPPLTPTKAAKVDIKLGSNIKTQVYRCDACSVTLNSDKQWEQHHRGLRHKIAIGKAKPPPPAQQGWEGVRFKKIAHTLIGLSTSSGSNMGTYYCKECDITVNSQKQLDQHLTSEKHKRVKNGEFPVRGKGKGRGGGPSGRGGKPRGRGGPQKPVQNISSNGTVNTVLPLSKSFISPISKPLDVKPAQLRGTTIHAARGLIRPPLIFPGTHVFGRGIPISRGFLPTESLLFGRPQLPSTQVWI